MGILNQLYIEGDEHWRKYRPIFISQFDSEQEYEQALKAAVASTKSAMETAIKNGMGEYEAWMTYREEWLILPDIQGLETSETGWWLEEVDDDV